MGFSGVRSFFHFLPSDVGEVEEVVHEAAHVFAAATDGFEQLGGFGGE